jgi:endonuclease YncB( thermonuclease family)
VAPTHRAGLGSVTVRRSFPKLLRLCGLSALCVLCACDRPAPSQFAGREGGFSARVIAVKDGDTVKVLTPNKTEIDIRLAEIDAPEKGQPGGRGAKAALARLVHGEEVQVVPIDRDRRRRLVAHLYLNNVNVNAVMMLSGQAWAYLEYQRDPRFTQWELQARRKSVGIWALPAEQRAPPWAWRKCHGDRSCLAAEASGTN